MHPDPVIAVDPSNGEPVAAYPSMTAAADAMGVSDSGAIHHAVTSGGCCGGWGWIRGRTGVRAHREARRRIRPIAMIDPSGMEVAAIFESAAEASKSFGVTSETIRHAISSRNRIGGSYLAYGDGDLPSPGELAVSEFMLGCPSKVLVRIAFDGAVEGCCPASDFDAGGISRRRRSEESLRPVDDSLWVRGSRFGLVRDEDGRFFTHPVFAARACGGGSPEALSRSVSSGGSFGGYRFRRATAAEIFGSGCIDRFLAIPFRNMSEPISRPPSLAAYRIDHPAEAVALLSELSGAAGSEAAR